MVPVGLTLDNTGSPTTLRQLTLSIGDLESPKDAAVHSEPLDIEQEHCESNDTCIEDIEHVYLD